MQQLFTLIASLLSFYSFIIFIRIIFSWINMRGNNYGPSQNKIVAFLYKITDPYLNWFRRFKFLQIGFMDFSTILAIVSLYFVANIFTVLGTTGSITITIIAIILLNAVKSLISSILTIFTIIIIIRIVFIQLNKYSNIFYNLDGYIEPWVRRFSNIFTKKFTSYKVNLIILTLSMIATQFAVSFILNSVIRFLAQLQ